MQDRGKSPRTGWTDVTKNGQEWTARAPREIAIARYPDAQETCIHGLIDLFMYADYFARMHATASPSATPHPAGAHDQPFLRTFCWQPGFPSATREAPSNQHSEADVPPAVVIIPAYRLGPPEGGHSAETIEWVQRMHARGAVAAAVCGGVFLLAETGLLHGRPATTHWVFAAELRRRHPGIRVQSERLVLDDGDVVTAGGVLAWADMGLTLVERLLGRAVMCATARFMLMDPPRREQRYYGDFSPPRRHGDDAITSAQRWLDANAATSSSVASLAERAGLGARTFLRRFVKATGMKPSEYQQRLRIARGRELLECTRRTVDEIALATGYEDPRGFRRTFKRVVGLSPTEYRRRFHAPAVPSAADRADHRAALRCDE